MLLEPMPLTGLLPARPGTKWHRTEDLEGSRWQTLGPRPAFSAPPRPFSLVTGSGPLREPPTFSQAPLSPEQGAPARVLGGQSQPPLSPVFRSSLLPSVLFVNSFSLATYMPRSGISDGTAA